MSRGREREPASEEDAPVESDDALSGAVVPLSLPPDGGHPPPQRREGSRQLDGSADPISDPPSDDPIPRIRELADAGETGAAWKVLREALAAEPMNPVLRFYEGLVAGSLGREAEAEKALRAALYLDRAFVMAHYHLGLMLLAQGRDGEAGRALDNALALSQALPPDAILPEGDGAVASEVAAGVAAARAGSDSTMRGRA